LQLQSVIQDTLQLYEQELQSGRVTFTCADEGLWMAGDVQQLRQVVHNLLQNALDAAGAHQRSDNASARVEIQLFGQNDDLVCQVRDNGAGFAPHILAHAFEPYNTTKPKGTGLGLAMVRKIVQEHHGDIKLSNIPSKLLPNTSDSVTASETALAGLGALVQLSFPILIKDRGV
jgi:nitrogen fixation/metabolism regulation signal transduction histidine kinase